MKRIILSLLFAALCTCSFGINAVASQDDQVTITGNTITLASFIKQVESQSHYLFVYSTEDVDINSKVTISPIRKTVAQCLVEALNNTNLKYVYENNYIILTTQSPEYLTVSAKVTDLETNEPLASASVYLSNRVISIVTNGEGYFQLKFPVKYIDESVIVSYLGYTSKGTSIRTLLSGKDNIIALKAIVYNLNPVHINISDGLGLVSQALAKISDNYPSHNMQMTSYYREMIKKGRSYVTLTEAVLDINKAPYNNYGSKDQIAIFKGRGSVDTKKIDTLFVKFRGGMKSALDIDIAKYPFLGVDRALIGNHYTFTKGQTTVIDGKNHHIVFFQQNPGDEQMLFSGKLYIEEKSLAITRIEFSMNVEEYPDQAIDLLLKKKPAGMKAKFLYAKYIVQYKEINGKWLFNYCRSELKFDSKWDRKLFKDTYTIVSEMAVTEYSDNDYKIPYDKRVKYNDITLDKVSDFKDDNFWEEYNIIEPEYSIEQVLTRITKQLQKREKNRL